MKIKIITFCLLFAAIISSCKKEDLSTGNGPTANSFVPVLSKILINNESANEYLYNDSSILTEEKTKLDFTMHHYNEKGQLVTSEFFGNDDVLSSDLTVSQTAMNGTAWVTTANGKEGGIITYEYNDNGQLVKTTSTHPSLSCTEYSVFTYDANNKISRQTTYWENAISGYIDYAYDAKGNLTSEALYSQPAAGDPTLISTTTYTFDAQPNPFKAHNKLPIPGVNTNLNNILKETLSIHLSATDPDNVSVTENTYTYNTLGYPTSKNGNVTYVY